MNKLASLVFMGVILTAIVFSVGANLLKWSGHWPSAWPGDLVLSLASGFGFIVWLGRKATNPRIASTKTQDTPIPGSIRFSAFLIFAVTFFFLDGGTRLAARDLLGLRRHIRTTIGSASFAIAVSLVAIYFLPWWFKLFSPKSQLSAVPLEES